MGIRRRDQVLAARRPHHPRRGRPPGTLRDRHRARQPPCHGPRVELMDMRDFLAPRRARDPRASRIPASPLVERQVISLGRLPPRPAAPELCRKFKNPASALARLALLFTGAPTSAARRKYEFSAVSYSNRGDSKNGRPSGIPAASSHDTTSPATPRSHDRTSSGSVTSRDAKCTVHVPRRSTPERYTVSDQSCTSDSQLSPHPAAGDRLHREHIQIPGIEDRVLTRPRCPQPAVGPFRPVRDGAAALRAPRHRIGPLSQHG